MDIIGMFKGLENALDAASVRQQVISNNIANANTPNFRGQAVAFEDELRKAMDAKKAGSGEVQLANFNEDLVDEEFRIEMGTTDPDRVRAKVFNTGMKVDINKEMVNIAQNQIHYNMLADKLGGFMSSVQMVIDSTGK